MGALIARLGAWHTTCCRPPICRSGCWTCRQLGDSCNPLERLPAETQATLSTPSALFPQPPAGLESFEDFKAGDRCEYVRLVVKQLRCGKLGLARRALAGGTVLAVGKPGGQKQREVWHGRRVSQAAQPPFCPRHLASPSALAHIVCSDDKPCRVSKRDARCWFDQLRLPETLRQWMARPPVTSKELAEAGMDVAEQKGYLQPDETWEDGLIFPVSHVWPMGFSWSSFVAQEELLALCHDSGLGSDKVLSCDAPTPSDFHLVFGAATDDVMIFSTAGPGHTLAAAQRLDAQMASRAVQKNAAKDINDALDATCVGVNLERGFFLAMPPARCLSLAIGVLHFLTSRSATPKQLQQLLGVLQWFDLLKRPKLSVYKSVYDFARSQHEHCARPIPIKVLREIVASFLLGVYWLTDLRRPFLPLLSATDASTEYGFGASVAKIPTVLAQRIAQIAEKQGDFVVLDGGTLCGAAARRLGEAHHIDLSLDDFVDVFSVRARHRAHINVLEGEAFVLRLRWLLRTRRHHSTRAVVLIDSAVWCGAAAKGRSSTQLNRLLRRAAALEMMGDAHVHLVLVPSGENPSDFPSRGVRRRGSDKQPGCPTAPPPSPSSWTDQEGPALVSMMCNLPFPENCCWICLVLFLKSFAFTRQRVPGTLRPSGPP